MECTLIGLFVAAIVVAMIVSHSRTSSSTATAPRAESGVQITEERVPESGMRLWLVKATGSYQASQQSVQAALGFVVLDVTGGQSDPVICRVPELFENGLALSSREIRLPHQEGQFNDLVAGIVPIDSIVCPYRGHRRLRFMAFLRESKSQRVLWSEDCYRQYEQKGYGYKEQDEESVARIVCLAGVMTALSLADGSLGDEERVVVKKVIGRELDLLPLEKREAARGKVQRFIHELTERFRADRCALGVLDRSLRDCGTVLEGEFRAMLYEEAVRVCGADAHLEDGERDMLEVLRTKLGLSDADSKSIRERHLRIAMYAGAAEETLLEMDPAWDRARKLKHLRDEYRKWNARVTHNDDGIAREAEERLRLLARARAKLDALQP